MSCHFCGESIGNQICPCCGHDVDPEGLQAEVTRLTAELAAARKWAAAWKMIAKDQDISGKVSDVRSGGAYYQSSRDIRRHARRRESRR